MKSEARKSSGSGAVSVNAPLGIFQALDFANGLFQGAPMRRHRHRTRPLKSAFVFSVAWSIASQVSAVRAELSAPGFRPVPQGVHALVGARVFTKPGNTLERATIVIRDGWIVEVGPEVRPPADARIWDVSGQTIYPGFIDPYVTTPVAVAGGTPNGEVGKGGIGAAAGGYRFFGVSGQERDPGSVGPGYANPDVVPERRVVDGWTPDAKLTEEFRELGFTAINLVPNKGVVRGQSTVVALGDAGPNELVIKADVAQHVAFAVSSGDDTFPNSLMGVIALVRQTFLDAQFSARVQGGQPDVGVPRGARPAYNASLAALQATLSGKARQPVVFEPQSALMVERAGIMGRELGLEIQIVASGQEWRRPELAKATGASFIVPVVFPAPPKFSDDSAWENVSLDELRHWDWAPENPALLRRGGIEIALTSHGLGDRKDFRKNLRAALERGLSESDAVAALTSVPAKLLGLSTQLGTIEPGKIANLTVCDAKGYFDPDGKLRGVWVDGQPYEMAPAKESKAEAKSVPKESDKEKDKDKKTAEEQRELAKKRLARSPLEGRGALTSPPALLIRGATVWTSADAGILTNASVLVVDGKIRSVGAVALDALPAGGITVELPGIHVTPGILDCHSHSMVLGGVNEATLPSSAMVRIADVVNSEAETLHQQLAGGVTLVNLLHGSANPIGGQNCVIKLRDGDGPEELKFRNAPPGIKFALGENVKQSNWGEKYTTRFPQTRMGVPAFYRNRFTAAEQYADAVKRAEAGGPPVRRDLELEAIAEIIQGTRLIHCHSYRQDEILAFLRAMESFGVKVATLQHILEGYKVADEIARHGAGASTFADWWNYKVEVLDAIPYAASMMRERGVVVSINSDSSDHARRLNFEAAKAVKYGGTPEAEALKFVTLNAARQLRIDRWVGSIEPGKDADLALWSGSPLDSTSVCLQTWVDGRKYFDRALETDRAKALADERVALIAKAKKLTGGGPGGAPSEKAREAFFFRNWESASRLGVQQCLDCQMPHQP